MLFVPSLNDVSPYFYVLLSLEAAPTVQLDFDKFRKGPSYILLRLVELVPVRPLEIDLYDCPRL